MDVTLNSLCGISLNVTVEEPTLVKTEEGLPLNSLCGISLNVTDAVSAVFRGIGGENQRVIPLTPLLQQPL